MIDNIKKGKIFPHLIEVRLLTVRHSNHEDCSRPGNKKEMSRRQRKTSCINDTGFAKKCDKLKTTCRPSVW